jgi:hypothetical protein
MKNWSRWQLFPIAEDSIPDAPTGPGVYEVRHTLSGRVVAFGSASNVARALKRLRANGGSGSMLICLFRGQPQRVLDWEYRTCAAESRREANAVASRLLGLKQALWRKRLVNRLGASAW